MLIVLHYLYHINEKSIVIFHRVFHDIEQIELKYNPNKKQLLIRINNNDHITSNVNVPL